EIQQLHLAVVADEYIGGLNIPMHDQVGVRVRHCIEHILEKPDPRLNMQLAHVAVAINRLALNVLQNEIGLARSRYSSVQKIRNVGMREPPEYGAFPLKAFLASVANQSDIQELDSRTPREPSIGPLGQPDTSHSPLPDLRDQHVRPDRLPG